MTPKEGSGPPVPATPATSEAPIRPERALLVGAHPDDCEFAAGGTVAAWVAAGCRVTYVIATNGEKGTHDFNADPVELVRTREEEQREAARRLGVAQVHFLGYPDGELEVTLDARERLARIIRQERPDVLLTHDAWQRHQLHPDHRATGLLTTDAMVAARDHLYCPRLFTEEKLEPWRPSDVLLWSADQPDYHVDIALHLDQKLDALRAHRSQFADRAETDGELAEWVRGRAAERGSEAGLEYAEAFKRLHQ
ncbi:MAG: PIG-L deacetylase family protein [Candidatus Dormibacteria bacterium]